MNTESILNHRLICVAVIDRPDDAVPLAQALVDGGVRVLTWHVVDHASRRVEDGVPKMDRSAAVSFSTAQWTGVARALRDLRQPPTAGRPS